MPNLRVAGLLSCGKPRSGLAPKGNERLARGVRVSLSASFPDAKANLAVRQIDDVLA